MYFYPATSPPSLCARYAAPPEVQARWKAMDPLNVLNPGVGGLPASRRYGVAEPPQQADTPAPHVHK
jgi:hypothetical protein